tara:strand:+ start:977 stop:1162 length:186 start_codon:yes stop_codon:yes gene_type:complete
VESPRFRILVTTTVAKVTIESMDVYAGQSRKTRKKDRYRTKKAQDLRVDPAAKSNPERLPF